MRLHAFGWEVVLRPEQGATVAALRQGGRDLIVPLAEGADPTKGFHGGFWMGPWTNRLDGGRITVAGQTWQMPINRPAEDNALHGFFREHPWRVLMATSDAAALALAFATPPFQGEVRLDLALSEGALRLALRVTNTGDVATPMGFGWHPFFTRHAGTRLRFRATTRFGRDARNLAIDPAPSEGLDTADLDGLDTHFAGWDGVARLQRPDGALLLRAEGALARNLQVFSPQAADFVCVEPVSHAPDAVNNAMVAAHGPMAALPPGETLAGRLTLIG
jgi:aldose 1-epimerase